MAIQLRLGVIATACALSLITPAAHSAFAQDERPKAQPRTNTSTAERQAARRESEPARESAPARERAAPRESAPPQTRQSAPRSAAPESRRASTPRETSSTSGRTATRAERSAGNTNDAAASSGDQAVPRSGSRPRDGRATTARAVPRETVRREPRQTIIYYPRRDYPYGYGGYGLGYFYYDPYSWGSSYYPGSYGGYGSGYPGYGGYGGYGGYDNDSYGRYADGAIRLKVKPRQAEVYVDGYYVGRVDDFDGVFQRLTLEAGAHRIDIREPGLQPLSFDVRVRPGETITYDGDLRKLP